MSIHSCDADIPLYILQAFSTNKAELFQKCIEHCDILRYEFILSKPCQQIEHLLEETLDRLKDQQLLSQPEQVSCLYQFSFD